MFLIINNTNAFIMPTYKLLILQGFQEIHYQAELQQILVFYGYIIDIYRIFMKYTAATRCMMLQQKKLLPGDALCHTVYKLTKN